MGGALCRALEMQRGLGTEPRYPSRKTGGRRSVPVSGSVSRDFSETPLRKVARSRAQEPDAVGGGGSEHRKDPRQQVPGGRIPGKAGRVRRTWPATAAVLPSRPLPAPQPVPHGHCAPFPAPEMWWVNRRDNIHRFSS